MSSPALFLWLLVAAAVLVSLYVVWPLLRRTSVADSTADGHTEASAAALNRDIIRERRQRLDEELAALPKDSPEREALVQEFATAALADLAPENGNSRQHAGKATAPTRAHDTAHTTGGASLKPTIADSTAGARPVPSRSAPVMTRRRQLLAVVFATLLVAMPLAFYRTTGMPEAVVPGFDQQAQMPDVNKMLAQLEAKLEAEPDLVEGWLMLGRSRRALGDLDKATAALEKALKLDSPDPALAAQIRTDLADTLGQQAGMKLEGRPWELIQQALKLNPGNGKALALAGAHEMNHGNARAALGYWEPLLAQLKPGTPQYQQVQQYIDAARQQADSTGAGPRANPGAGNGTSAAPAGETAGRGTSVPPTNEAAGKP